MCAEEKQTRASRPFSLNPTGTLSRRVPAQLVCAVDNDRADAEKNVLKPHLKEQWVIPPRENSAFVAGMEDLLDVYQPAFAG
jgi:hypothetical protein